MKYHGIISYRIDDKKYMFDDHYVVDRNWHDDVSARAWIENDLKLVAGGGYNTIAPASIDKITIIREG